MGNVYAHLLMRHMNVVRVPYQVFVHIIMITHLAIVIYGLLMSDYVYFSQ